MGGSRIHEFESKHRVRVRLKDQVATVRGKSNMVDDAIAELSQVWNYLSHQIAI